VKNCVGAGRIEGWFLTSNTQVEPRGWGHVQSFSFEGNLVFRVQNSALLQGAVYRQKDPVTFEVVQVRSGGCEAVHLALPGMEAMVPEPRLPGEDPWEAPGGGNAGGKDGGKDGKGKGKLGPEASSKRRDRTWGNEDGLGVFFGGLSQDVTEEQLQAFAQSVGTVTYAKIFVDGETGTSRGCGKVFYSHPWMAERALAELAGAELYGRPVTVEVLGQESEKKRRRRLSQQGWQQEVPETEEGPRLLPLSYFSDDDTTEAKLDLCFAAFEDILENHNPEATGKGMVWMVRSLVKEVNDVLADDIEAKQAFGNRLRKHPWFAENGQLVRWQASKNRINISKMSPSTPMWKAWQEEKNRLEQLQQQEESAAGRAQQSLTAMAAASRLRLQQLGAMAAQA